MNAPSLSAIARHLDVHLRVTSTPDFPGALNGVQLEHAGPVRRIAAAVDASLRTIDGAIAAGANLLLVHHGLFWGGPHRLEGHRYARIQRLIANDVAVYAAHLPLDVHEVHGNSRLLGLALNLEPSAGFARYDTVMCGVQGHADVATEELFERLRSFSREHGGEAIATRFDASRRTRRWAICSGSGATADTIREALAEGVDTLIVGEGPHWSAVDADDAGLVILYGGHYATETLGVRSLAAHLEQAFALPWDFVPAPTGL